MDIRINPTAYTRVLLDTVLERRLPARGEIERAIGPIETNRIIAVCATPKSGSTFLTNVLARTTSRPYLPVCYAYSSNEQDLYLPALVTAAITGAVSQLHMRATPHNVELLNVFRVRPIVLTRNLFDSVESLARDLRSKQDHEHFGTGWVGYSFAWLEPRLREADDDELHDFIIDLALPWYVNFYVSWYRLERQGLVAPVWLRFEELMSDKRFAVEGVLAELGLDHRVNDAHLERDYLRDQDYIGSGGGTSGRGLEKLSAEQVARIRRLLGHYPDVDFANFGL